MYAGGYVAEVVGLSPNATEKDIHEFFSHCGDPVHVEIIRSGECGGTAYVTFSNAYALETAVLLSGAAIVDQPVCIIRWGEFTDEPNPWISSWGFDENSGSMTTHVGQFVSTPGEAVTVAQDAVKTMIAKGYVLSKDALVKAKALDESYGLSASAAAKVAELSNRIGLTDKINASMEAIKSVDEKYHVSDITKSAASFTGKTAVAAGTAVVNSSTPFPWPKSRDYVPYANAPYKSLTVEKAIQNWIQYEGNVFRFPGGGTQFPQGADKYIDQLASVIPIKNGTVRTALDTGCGVASWGAYLWSRNVIAMSFAPRDSHEAQVQFALERGVPAVIGVLGTIKMPYPSRAFDMAHCSRCLIPWGANDGRYMIEVDRVLRPGGYWVLSGPPINWKTNYKAWQRPKEELQEEQRKIEEIANLLCWEKKSEKGEIAVWQKKVNDESCRARRDDSRANFCKSSDADDIWYKKMEGCITPYPEVAGGELKAFPERLYAIPPRISSGSIPGVSAESYQEDSNKWKKHVNAYKKINRLLDSGRYRNIMDMNAGFGGFAAAIQSPKLWVMNVVPTIADKNTLGVIYERGLIGIYHDWCEAFSTYPRTYDLIHAHGLFSLYKDKCNIEDILLEMDRILRPEGAIIIRDEVDEIIKVKKIVGGMRWDTKMVDHEDGPLVPEKILVAVKQYWVASGNSTSS